MRSIECAVPSAASVRPSSLCPPRAWAGRLRQLLGALAALAAATMVAAVPAFAQTDAEVIWRWMPPFHVPVPADWHPMLDRGAVSFYTGRNPESREEDIPAGMSQAEFDAIPFGVVRVGRESPPRKNPTLEGFLEDFTRMREDPKVRNFELNREDVMIGSHPAVLVTVRAEGELEEGRFAAIDFNVAVSREPDAEGMFLMAAIGASRDFFDANRDRLKAMLAQADDSRPPPLEVLRETNYLIEGESFGNTFGPAVAPDGVIALGDTRTPRVRVFAPDGTVMHEWGTATESGKPSQNGSFRRGAALAFGPQGRVLVADEGFFEPAVLVFERDGSFIVRHSLSEDALGEQALDYFYDLWVNEDGSFGALGRNAKTEQVVVHTLGPDGALLRSFALSETGVVAPMPDGGVVVGVDGGRADQLVRLDREGKEIARWSLLGTALAPLPGDGRQYFSIENVATDGDGRIYVYDRMGYAIWIYSPEGAFLHVLPTRGLVNNHFHQMRVTARGDMLIQDRPSSYSSDPGVLRWLETHIPASVGSAIAPATSAPRAAVVDDRPAELIALATAGKLNVRALRGFGKLEGRYDTIALTLRGQGLDLYAADAATIESWLIARASQTLVLPEESIEPLQLLAIQLRDFERQTPAAPQNPCVCVDLDGDGIHSVMKYGGTTPVQVRANAGDVNACMQWLEKMPECQPGQ